MAVKVKVNKTEETEQQTTKDANQTDNKAQQVNNEPPVLPQDPEIETVALDYPITRGSTTIDKLNIKKPKTGALRGLSLAKVMELDVDTLMKLVPRISTPTITEYEVGTLDPADLVKVSTAVVGFFAGPKQKQQIEMVAASQIM